MPEKLEFRTLRADEIELRVAQITKNKNGPTGVQLLLYKDARCDMNILDETVGCENWQRRHDEHRGNLFCSVGIRCADGWAWKEDAGSESNTEAEKGHASDSFKRACVNWGIGRELYTAPFVWIPVGKCEITAFEQSGKTTYRCKDYFAVEAIGYDERRAISFLRVINSKTKALVYGYGEAPTSESARRREVGKCDECGLMIADTEDFTAENIVKASLRKWNKRLCWVCSQKRLRAEGAE